MEEKVLIIGGFSRYIKLPKDWLREWKLENIKTIKIRELENGDLLIKREQND